MLARSWEGARALCASLSRARREPERIVFALGHDGALCGQLISKPRLSRLGTSVALLGLSPLRRGAYPWVHASLLAAAGLKSAQLKHPESPRIIDVGLAAATYGAQAMALHQYRGAQLTTGVLARMGLVLAGAVYASRKNPQLIPAVLVGGMAASTAGSLANDPALRRQGIEAAGISHGANLMFASEALNVLSHNRLSAAAALSAHLLGQLLLVDGITR